MTATAQILALLSMDQPLDRIEYLNKLLKYALIIDREAKTKALRGSKLNDPAPVYKAVSNF